MKTLYFNGKIFTGEEMVSAFIVEGDKFVNVGESNELKRLSHDKEVDLKGDFVTAGFNDSHLHITGLGGSLQQADLNDCTSIADVKNIMKEYIKKIKLKKVCG